MGVIVGGGVGGREDLCCVDDHQIKGIVKTLLVSFQRVCVTIFLSFTNTEFGVGCWTNGLPELLVFEELA